MFCSKCGNEIPEGNKFCSKCGTPATSNVVSAAASATTPTPVAVPTPSVSAVEPKVKKEKKSHKGLAAFLIIFFVILLLAIGAVASWLFLVPQATKDYLKMEKNLKDGKYDKVLEYFDFSNEDLSEDNDGFKEFAKENLEAGFGIAALFNGNYVIKGKDGEDYTLAFDEDSKKFGGDQFTYSFTICRPSIKNGVLAKDYERETIAGFLGEKSFKCKFNALLGDDETTETNNVEVEVSLKNGKLDKIENVDIEMSQYSPEIFAHIDNNELVFDTMAVDEGYAYRVAQKYGEFISEYTQSALYGEDIDDYMSKYNEYVFTDNYTDEYKDLTENAEFYDEIGYDRYIEVSNIEPLDVYHMGDTGLIIAADYVGEISTYYDYYDIDEVSYLLIRPENSLNQVILNADRKESIEEYNELIDGGLSFNDAYYEILSTYARDEDDDAAIDFNKYLDFDERLDDEEKEAYYDSLMDFADEAYDYAEDPKFTMVDIGEYYPLMVCASGDYHAAACELYMYDGKKVNNLGYFGEYSSISLYGNVISWSGGNMGYYTTFYYEIKDGKATKLLELTEDSSGSTTKYYDEKGKTITEKEYNSQLDKMYEYAMDRAAESGIGVNYISYYDMQDADVYDPDELFY